jgi:hypothetical protein
MTHAHNCDCNEPVRLNSPLDIMTRGVARQLARYCSTNGCTQSEAVAALERTGRGLTAASSRVLSTRLTHTALSRVQGTAAKLGIKVPDLIRLSVQALVDGANAADPASVLGQLAAALSLPDSAAPSEILTAVQALVDALDPSAAPDAEPSSESEPLPATMANATPEQIKTYRELRAQKAAQKTQLAASREAQKTRSTVRESKRFAR